MKRVFLDIETTPDPSDPRFGESPEELADYMVKVGREEMSYLRTGLVSSRARLASIAVAVDDGPVECQGIWKTDWPGPVGDLEWWDAGEFQLLEWLLETITKQGIHQGHAGIIVGHNVKGFDVPVLMHRAIRYDHRIGNWLPWPKPGDKPWDVREHHDTWDLWKGTAFSMKGGGQSEICKMLRIDMAEDDGDGSDVYRWFIEERYQLIAKHNLADVADNREIYRRLCPAWAAAMREQADRAAGIHDR